MEENKATKMSRYDNIHLGTDVKSTAKDIKLTPGPGHYYRVDEQYPRTFHHATKNGTQASPVFSDEKKKRSLKKGLNTE